MAGRSDIEAGRAHILLYVKNSSLVKGLNAAKKELQGLGRSVMQIGGWLTGMGASIVGPLAGAVLQFSSAGDALGKMAARTGVSAETLAELGFAAEQGGANIDDVEKGIRKMQRTILDADTGMQSSVESLDMLGLSAAELKAQKPEDQFQAIADALVAVEDPSRRAALAMEVLGKSGTQLLPMLSTMREVREEARKRGLVPSEEAVKDAEAINDAFGRIRQTGTTVAFEIGAALAPMLLPALETIAQIGTATIHWVKANGSLIRTIAAVAGGVLAVGVGITAVGALIFGLGTAFGLVAGAVTTVAALIGGLLSPTVLVVAAIAAGVYAWARFTASGQATVKTITSGLTELLRIGKDVVDGIGDALLAGDLALAGEIAIAGLKLVFAKGIAWVADMLGGTLGDAVGDIGEKLLKGDLAGAWDTVVKGMGKLWADFAEGMVAVFTMAARSVTDLWQNTVNKITDFIFDNPLISKLALLGTGIDMDQAQADRDRMNAQLGLGPENVRDEAKAAAQEQTAATADASRSWLDNLDKSMQHQSDAIGAEFRSQIGGSGDRLREEADRLAAELAELKNQAAEAREAIQKPSEAGDVDGAGGLAGLTAGVSSTFSAAGAVALGFGGGGGPTMRIARGVEKLVAKTEESVVAQKESGKALSGIAAALLVGE